MGNGWKDGWVRGGPTNGQMSTEWVGHGLVGGRWEGDE